ncbi:MAG: hypothetical protein ACREAU_00295, partial [Nitrosopumilaceae archaeon]
MLKQVIKEMAAGGTTGGGAITSFRGSLFGGGLITRVGKKSNKRKRLSEDTQSNFDPSDVLSKMKAAEKKIRTEDVAGFALEDEEGNLIKVYVQADQAKDFEHSLGMILGGGDDEEGSDDEEETTSMDIAEALYRLKDRFNIVDVDWGDIVGDSEEEQEVAGAPGQAGAAVGGEAEVPPEGAEGAIPAEGGTEEPGMEAGVGAEDEEGAKTALQQVIDMLKSQAEATKAEADAKKAEYDAKIAEYSAKASGAKVKQEED